MACINPRVTAMRRRHSVERSHLLNEFLRQISLGLWAIDGDLDNWTPDENEAWQQFTAEMVARQRTERCALAIDR